MSSAPTDLKSSGWVSVGERQVARRDIVRSAPHAPRPRLDQTDSKKSSDNEDDDDEQLSYDATMDRWASNGRPCVERKWPEDDSVKGLDEEFDDILTSDSPRETPPSLLQKRSRSLPNLAPSAKQQQAVMRLSLRSSPRKIERKTPVESIVEDQDSLSPARGDATRCSICSTDGPSAARESRSVSISQIYGSSLASSWGSSKKNSLLSMPMSGNLQVSNSLTRTATNSNSSLTSRGSGMPSPTDSPLILANLESFPQPTSDDELTNEDEQRISDIILQASNDGSIELISYFLQVGMGRIDAKDALTRAASRGHLQAAQVLVEHVWSKRGVLSAADAARKNKHKGVAKFLRARADLMKKTFKRSFSREDTGFVSDDLINTRPPAKSLSSLRRLLDSNNLLQEDLNCLVRSAASTGNVLGMKYFMGYRDLSDQFIGELLEAGAGAVCDGSAYQMVRLLLEGRWGEEEVQKHLPNALVAAVKAHHLYTASFIAGRFPELPENESLEDDVKKALDDVIALAIKRDKAEIIQSICECKECNKTLLDGVTGQYMPKLFRDTVWGKTFDCALYLFERLQMGMSMIQVARSADHEELVEEMESGEKRRKQLVQLATDTSAVKSSPAYGVPPELWKLIAEYSVYTCGPPPSSAGFRGPNSLDTSLGSLPPSLASTRPSLASTRPSLTGRPSRPSLSRSP